MTNIAVFASHKGSDMQAIADGCKSGKIDGRVSAVISNNPDALVLRRAEAENIDAFCINSKLYPDPSESDAIIINILREHDVGLLFLAGYLKKLGKPVIEAYANRIFNIHPALLPKFGGKGMYGMNVHRAVIAAGDKVTGITVHRADGEYDTGEIVAQTAVEVYDDDTVEILAERVLKREHAFLAEVVNDIVSGKIKLG